MKLRFIFLIFILTLFISPLESQAAECCIQTNLSSCSLKTTTNCNSDSKSTDCNAYPNICPQFICCTFVSAAGSVSCDEQKKGYDCSKNNSGSNIWGINNKSCAEVVECAKSTLKPPDAPSDSSIKPFEPVLPKLQINIPGVQFSNIKVRPGENVSIPWIMEYIQGVYKYLVGVAIFLAIIMVSIAGLRWMTSGGNASVIGDAKKQIGNAVIGLLLVFGIVVILQTINPQLINLGNINIKTIAPEYLIINDDADADIMAEDEAHPLGSPTWNYQTFDDTMCANPPEAAGVADPKSVITYNCPNAEGQITSVPEMKEPLCQAATLARQRGYTLVVKSSYRSFDKQVSIWCGVDGDCKAKYPDRAIRKKYCAVPGFSNHGLGRAVDVVLKKDGKQLFYINSRTQCMVDASIVAAIADIFYKADSNWKRYDNEIWHFEYGTNTASRSQTTGYPPTCSKK